MVSKLPIDQKLIRCYGNSCDKKKDCARHTTIQQDIQNKDGFGIPYTYHIHLCDRTPGRYFIG